MVVIMDVTSKLPGDVQAAIPDGIAAAATKWRVTLPENVSYEFSMTARRFGNKKIAKTTLVGTYLSTLRQFWRFCAYIGDYDSMIILLTPATGRTPSMNNHTIEQFLRFKRRKDTALLDDGEIPVLDIHGNQVMCEGKWNNPQKAKHFISAVNNLHAARGAGGQYHDVCEDCADMPVETRHLGCDTHNLVGARLYRVGNPGVSTLVKNTLHQVSDPNYQEHGCSQLLPSMIRALRTALLPCDKHTPRSPHVHHDYCWLQTLQQTRRGWQNGILTFCAGAVRP